MVLCHHCPSPSLHLPCLPAAPAPDTQARSCRWSAPALLSPASVCSQLQMMPTPLKSSPWQWRLGWEEVEERDLCTDENKDVERAMRKKFSSQVIPSDLDHQNISKVSKRLKSRSHQLNFDNIQSIEAKMLNELFKNLSRRLTVLTIGWMMYQPDDIFVRYLPFFLISVFTDSVMCLAEPFLWSHKSSIAAPSLGESCR